MELAEMIIARYFKNHEHEFEKSEIAADLKRILDLESYKALRKSREILNDDTLDDPECFWQIEKHVCTF